MYLQYQGVKIQINLKGTLDAICPISNQQDYYEWDINYVPRNRIIEVLKLKEQLIEWRTKKITAEDLANKLNEIAQGANPYNSKVYVTDYSDGIQIAVEVL